MWFFLGNESFRHYDRESAIRYLKNYISFPDWDEERSLSHIYIAQMLEANGDIEHRNLTSPPPQRCSQNLRLTSASREWPGSERRRRVIRHHEKGRLPFLPSRMSSTTTPRTVTTSLQSAPPRRISPRACGSAPKIRKRLKYAPDDARSEARSRRSPTTTDAGTKTSTSSSTPPALSKPGTRTRHVNAASVAETAVVHVSRELAARGHKVRVFCHCEGIEGVFEGVEYIPYEKFDYEKTACDVFITSRRVATLIEGNVKARLKVIWMHDNHVGQGEPDLAKGLLRADLIMGVSRWHRDVLQKTYPFVNPTKMIATRNGIDKRLFFPINHCHRRNRNSSSPRPIADWSWPSTSCPSSEKRSPTPSCTSTTASIMQSRPPRKKASSLPTKRRRSSRSST